MAKRAKAPVKELDPLVAAFKKVFPLADERDLPNSPARIPRFLEIRVKLEVDEATLYFQHRVVQILCEVTHPKHHVEDMARAVVELAKEAKTLRPANEELRKEEALSRQAIAALRLVRQEAAKVVTQLGSETDRVFYRHEFLELMRAVAATNRT